jgi:hypothetical protein
MEQLIFCDHIGYPNRASILRAVCKATGVQFHHISPPDSTVSGADTITINPNWLPTIDTGERHATWYRCHLPYIAAASPDADYVWCIEGDVSANPIVWARMIVESRTLTQDGLSARLSHRAESPNNRWFRDANTPADFDHYWLQAITRLSRRAVGWLVESAERNRNIFSEVEAPSEIVMRGGTLAKLNQKQNEPLCHPCTMKFNDGNATTPKHPRRLLHPVKFDDVT